MPPQTDAGRGDAVVDLASLAQAGAASGALWAYGGDDLNANLVLLTAGEAIAPPRQRRGRRAARRHPGPGRRRGG